MKKLRINMFNMECVFHFLILFIAFILGFLLILKNGYGNEYYASGIRSMIINFHNFFFNSYDPAGFISIDKPPFAFWIQTLFAKIFGYHGLAILLPSLLAQVLSIELIYRIVRKYLGNYAALFSSLIFALTPIAFLMGSTNHPDSILILLLILSMWSVLKSIENNKFAYLLLSFIFLGLAFNTKTLQTFIIFPSVVLTYFFASSKTTSKKILELLLSTIIFVVISLSWIWIVDLTPKNERPFVGSTTDNSEISLTFGYNGVQRIFENEDLSTNSAIYGNGEGCEPGIFRMFNEKNGGQIGWFLILAILGSIITLKKNKISKHFEKIRAFWFFNSLWLLVGLILLSSIRFLHPYYTTLIAPPIAMLSGAGLAYVISSNSKKYLYEAIILITVASELLIFKQFHQYKTFGIVIIVLTALYLIISLLKNISWFRYFGIILISLIPSLWIFHTIKYGADQTIPSAGPTVNIKFNSVQTVEKNNDALIQFLLKNRTNEKYILATNSSFNANEIIIKTGETVLVWGGFIGNDPALSLDELMNLISEGKLRYVYVDKLKVERNRGEGYFMNKWIFFSCSNVSEYKGLYDCKK